LSLQQQGQRLIEEKAGVKGQMKRDSSLVLFHQKSHTNPWKAKFNEQEMVFFKAGVDNSREENSTTIGLEVNIECFNTNKNVLVFIPEIHHLDISIFTVDGK